MLFIDDYQRQFPEINVLLNQGLSPNHQIDLTGSQAPKHTFTRFSLDTTGEKGNLVYQYAFAMRGNFVLEVYRILDWFRAGTTESSRAYQQNSNKKYWEFVGDIAEDKIRKKYRNKSLMKDGSPLHATQLGFRYLN